MSDEQPDDLIIAPAPTLEQRLAAAKARKEAATAALEADAPLRAVLRAEQEAENAEAIAKAVAANGEIGVKIAIVPAPAGKIVIVKRCHPAIFKQFSERDGVSFEENEKLVRPCIVHPAAKDFDELANDAPAVINICALKICELMGARKTELASK